MRKITVATLQDIIGSEGQRKNGEKKGTKMKVGQKIERQIYKK